MNRILAILLIPFFVMGTPHAHSQCVVAHPSADYAHPHIHIGGGSHHHPGAHGHSHHSQHAHSDDWNPHEDHRQNEVSSDSHSCMPVDHNSDAVYFLAADALFTIAKRCCLDNDMQVVISSASVDCRDDVLHQYSTQALQHGSAGRPLYLLHAALRL